MRVKHSRTREMVDEEEAIDMFPTGTPYIAIKEAMGSSFMVGYIKVDKVKDPAGYLVRMSDYKANRDDLKD